MKLEDYKGDKRSKAYKAHKKAVEQFNAKQVGVGDIIAKAAAVTGVETIVKKLFGKDCGCEERQAKVNKFFGKTNIRPLTPEEYIYLDGIIKQPKINPEDQKKLVALFEDVFQKRVKFSCSTCSFMSAIYKPLKKLFDLYEY